MIGKGDRLGDLYVLTTGNPNEDLPAHPNVVQFMLLVLTFDIQD